MFGDGDHHFESIASNIGPVMTRRNKKPPRASAGGGVMAAIAQSRAPRAPIGPWAAAAWGALAIVLSEAVPAIILTGFASRWLAFHPGLTVQDLRHNGWLSALSLTMGMAIYIGVVIVAVRRAGQRTSEYLGLIRPSAADMIMFICAAGVVIIMSVKGWTPFSDRPQQFSIEAYRGMAASGMIVMLLASVVAAPIGEEILYRGFLYRAWAPRLGFIGTIALTSSIFAATHLQYDLRGMAMVFFLGLLFGGARWASGSTLLSMLMHAVTNVAATIRVAAIIEGW
jgi:membrane protease YdiL (CAAX protease family)